MLSVEILGTSGADTFVVAADSGTGGVSVTLNNGSPTIVGPGDTLRLDTLDAPEGQSDTISIADDLLNPLDLVVAGGSGSRSLTVNGGTVNLDLALRGGDLSVVMNGGVVNLRSTQHLSDLELNDSSRFTLPEGQFRALVLDSLSIGSSATLDVNDNALIVNYPSGDGDAVLADVTGWLVTGYNASSGWWDGPGIASTSAHNNSSQTTDLGVMNNTCGGQPWCSSFMGQPVGANAILVRYTYDGDADLSGVINSADYAHIDNGFANDLSGWANGDFNFDGVVDANDYFEIDRTYRTQAHAPAVSIAGDVSVNEGSQYQVSLDATTQGVAAISNWTIYPGDGSVDTATAQTNGHTPADYTYGDEGTYTIAAFAKGPDLYYVATKTVQVNDVPPTISITGATSVNVNDLYELTLSATDPGNDPITWQVDWGDGSALSSATGREPDPQPTHTYTQSDQYYITVVAQDDDGSYFAEKVVQAGQSLVAPSELVLESITDSAVALSWVDNSADENGFSIEMSTDGIHYTQIAITDADATSVSVDHAFAALTTYYFRVRAVEGYGLSGSSNTVAVTTPAVPGTPSALLVSAITSGSEADISFTDSATNEDGFVLEWSLADSPFSAEGSAYAPANTGTGTVGFVGGGSFAPDTDYYFRVCAYNSFTSSAWSSIVGPITAADYPDAPSDLEATTVSTSEIDLTWTDNSSNETGFYLWRSADGETWSACPGTITASPYSDTSLPPGMTYYYRVAAYNSYGTSDCAYAQGAYRSRRAAERRRDRRQRLRNRPRLGHSHRQQRPAVQRLCRHERYVRPG